MSHPDIEMLRTMYPSLSDQELEIADENLTRYVEVVLKIFERLQEERSRENGEYKEELS